MVWLAPTCKQSRSSPEIHNPPDARAVVVALELVPLLLAAVAADGRHVEHAVAELHERAALHRQVQVRNVAQAEVDELLLERGRGEKL